MLREMGDVGALAGGNPEDLSQFLNEVSDDVKFQPIQEKEDRGTLTQMQDNDEFSSLQKKINSGHDSGLRERTKTEYNNSRASVQS